MTLRFRIGRRRILVNCHLNRTDDSLAASIDLIACVLGLHFGDARASAVDAAFLRNELIMLSRGYNANFEWLQALLIDFGFEADLEDLQST